MARPSQKVRSWRLFADMKLLKGLFARLLLRITNAADQYIDYTSTSLRVPQPGQRPAKRT